MHQKLNEDKLTFFPKKNQLNYVDMTSTADENLSPVLDVKNATFVYGRNKINNPVLKIMQQIVVQIN